MEKESIFSAPEAEVVRFPAQDIVTTSQDADLGDDLPFIPGFGF